MCAFAAGIALVALGLFVGALGLLLSDLGQQAADFETSVSVIRVFGALFGGTETLMLLLLPGALLVLLGIGLLVVGWPALQMPRQEAED
ncbi:hypothetical protein GO986_11530 [Deinococcus sp. HMF7620]|uniref:Uncharacterized protein n=1 Tax=Deinococcus arboris TaxID=2682977 RepID=A0A7C9LLD4_9DEIO|nr:hypothetical protein [Deinococcus arboris]MVN87398.1 hypothetical protein [Deinococcus arboris]